MKVKSKWVAISLTAGEVYDVINESSESYQIVDDDGTLNSYAKNQFEVMPEEKIKIIVCSRSHPWLTQGRKYGVLIESSRFYRVIADNGLHADYLKYIFEEVPESVNPNPIKVSLKDEIKLTKKILADLEEKEKTELASSKSKRNLNSVDKSWSVLGGGETHSFGVLSYKSACINNDNTFVDEQSASLQSQRNKLVYKMRVAALDSPVDWSDEGENIKYYASWEFLTFSYEADYSYTFRVSQLPHFASSERLDEFMNTLSSDEQQLLICGVE
jgi:hypothetical protein